jgi:release factor glutamine methyltransferase
LKNEHVISSDFPAADPSSLIMKKGTTLRSNIDKIYGGGPKQYQQGWTEFYKLKFKLTPDVLIPRPETELLVDEVLKLKPNSVVDVGTGSGCIAISIAKNSQIKVIAVDISEKALKVAEQNAKFQKVEDQIIFLQSDLLSFLNNLSKFDVIVANLPYIPTARLMHIDPLVSQFEPTQALDGGVDGFEVYRKLFSQMREKNITPKVLVAEIDEEQGEVALAEARKYFPQAQVEIKKDLAKKDRFLRVDFNSDS